MSVKGMSKDEVEAKINGVERELKAFLDDLPRCKGMTVGRESILTVIDVAIDLGKKTLSKHEDAQDLSLKAKLSITIIKHLLQQIEDGRRQFTPETPGVEDAKTPESEQAEQVVPSAKPDTAKKAVARAVPASHKDANDAKWIRKLEELRRFKEEHGDSNVPQTYEKNPQLGKWVMDQRYLYGNRSPRMTKKRIKLLNELGFTWVIRMPSARGPYVSWEDRLEQLQEYKAEHGDCNVPAKYSDNPKLGRWVSNQRTHYRLLKDGKRSTMTNDRIRKLNCLGFTWSLCKK